MDRSLPTPGAAPARRWPRRVALAALTGLLCFDLYTLARLPFLGQEDNGDYWRVMRPAGLAPPPPAPLTRPVDGAQRLFVRTTPRLDEGFSSAALLAWASRLVPGWLLGAPADRVDLRQAGLLYLALLTLALALGLAGGVPPLLCLLLAWAASDPQYLLLFNSYFADPPLLIALTGAALWLCCFRPSAAWRWRWPLRWGPGALARAAWLAALSLLGGLSKHPYMLFPLLLLLSLPAALPFRRRAAGPPDPPGAPPPDPPGAPPPDPPGAPSPDPPGAPPPWWRAALALGLVLLLGGLCAAAPWHFAVGRGQRFPDMNNFHAVFLGIAELSQAPDRALGQLGVPPSLWHLRGRSFFSLSAAERAQVQASGALQRLSRAQLLGLFLAEPGALVRAAAQLRRGLGRARPVRQCVDRSVTPPRRFLYTHPLQFSYLRRALVHHAAPAWAGLLLLALAWPLATLVRRRPLQPPQTALLFLLLFFCSQLWIVLLGEGLHSLVRHLLAARLALDLLLALSLAALLDGAARWRARRRARGPAGAGR